MGAKKEGGRKRESSGHKGTTNRGRFAVSRIASSPIGRPNVPRRKYVARSGKNRPLLLGGSMRMLIRRRMEDRGDKPSSPIKWFRGFGNGGGLDGEFGTVSVMNERQGEKRSAKVGSA